MLNDIFRQEIWTRLNIQNKEDQITQKKVTPIGTLVQEHPMDKSKVII